MSFTELSGSWIFPNLISEAKMRIIQITEVVMDKKV